MGWFTALILSMVLTAWIAKLATSKFPSSLPGFFIYALLIFSASTFISMALVAALHTAQYFEMSGLQDAGNFLFHAWGATSFGILFVWMSAVTSALYFFLREEFE